MVVAQDLAVWAHGLAPTASDVELAQRSLVDTVAVALAGMTEPLLARCGPLTEAARWAVAAHVLDFDDLHVPSTTHISAVIVPVVLACNGELRHYLAGAGAMARLGVALGWSHYARGWHATCTAGAPSAALTAAIAWGLDPTETAHAVALAVPAAGGVQRAFGTDAKALQVGFAVEAGMRAAELAANGARADLGALDAWLGLVGAEHAAIAPSAAAVPGGLAIKLHPCCYAMQRPISAVREFFAELDHECVERVCVSAPEATIHPLLHHRPTTGLQGKFSLEYAIASALIDGFPALAHFTDEAVTRPDAQRLISVVETVTTPGGDDLLAGEMELVAHLRGGETRRAVMALPPGAPDRPPTAEEMARKAAGCGPGLDVALAGIDAAGAARLLREAGAR